MLLIRSHQQIPGDPSVSYSHYIVCPFFAALVVISFIVLVFVLIKFSFTRKLLLQLKSPGDGPSAEQRKKSSVTITLVAHQRQGKKLIKVEGREVYELTAELATHCVLCVLFDRSKLLFKNGVHTTAAAFGGHLLQRVRDSNSLNIYEV